MNTHIVKLSELFQVGSSKRVLKAQWQKSGIPFYRGREVTKLSQDGFVDNELFIAEELYSEYAEKYGVPTAGDIVITAIGTIGNSYIVRTGDQFYFKDASVLWLKRTSDVSSEYINLWLKSSLMREQLDEGNGATVDTLTIRKLQSLDVNIPPLDEQKRIVAILDQAFADIDKARATAERNLKNARELFDSYLQQVFSQRGEGWSVTTLGEVCTGVEYGSSAKSSKAGKIPVLRMGNIQSGKFEWDKLVYSNNDEEIEKYSLKYNDVLFNRTNSPALVGKTAIYKGEMPAIFAGYLIRIHRKENLLDADYLNYYLNSNIALDYGKTVFISSVNQANINGTKLKAYPIPLPSLEKQQSIVEQMDDLKLETQRLEFIYQKKIIAIDELKKSILQKAFSGELTKSKGSAA